MALLAFGDSYRENESAISCAARGLREAGFDGRYGREAGGVDREDEKTRVIGAGRRTEGDIPSGAPVSPDSPPDLDLAASGGVQERLSVHAAAMARGAPDIDLGAMDDEAPDATEAETRTIAGRHRPRPGPSTAAEPNVGRLINQRFRLERVLGQGGMGVVYAARDLRKEELGDDDSLIAIKLLSHKVRHLPNALRMLQQECTKAQGLAHPNIVTVYDFDRDGDVVYMTMELLKGQSLADHLAAQHKAEQSSARPARLSDQLGIISDIAQGLAYAHKRGIVHFDLKPGNVFITDEGRTKILDFGIARAVLTPGSDAGRGEDGTIALTPAYASLEMLRGMLPDPRDDIYALAIITYQLLSGRHPFDDMSAIDALHAKRKPARIPGLSERQWRGLQKGLALSRKERTISVEAFLDALSPRRIDQRFGLALATAAVASVVSLYFWLQPPQQVTQSLFDNPPPAAVLSAAERQRVDELLELADVHMLVGRLISPVGANARDVYQQVLDIHPYDRQAILGLKTLLVRLAQAAGQAMAAGEWHRAGELIDSGLQIDPDDTALLTMKQQLTRQEKRQT